MTLLSYYYDIIITSLLSSLLLHYHCIIAWLLHIITYAIITYYYNFIITYYYIYLRIITLLLHYHYIIITLLLHHYYEIITGSIITHFYIFQSPANLQIYHESKTWCVCNVKRSSIFMAITTSPFFLSWLLQSVQRKRTILQFVTVKYCHTFCVSATSLSGCSRSAFYSSKSGRPAQEIRQNIINIIKKATSISGA